MERHTREMIDAAIALLELGNEAVPQMEPRRNELAWIQAGGDMRTSQAPEYIIDKYNNINMKGFIINIYQPTWAYNDRESTLVYMVTSLAHAVYVNDAMNYRVCSIPVHERYPFADLKIFSKFVENNMNTLINIYTCSRRGPMRVIYIIYWCMFMCDDCLKLTPEGVNNILFANKVYTFMN